MNESSESQIEAVGSTSIAATSNGLQKTSPPYLKLIVDSWEHIFDNLSLLDIISMSKMCKRMNQLAGYYIGEYLPPFPVNLTKAGCEFTHFDYPISNVQYIRLRTDFHQFIQLLIVDEDSHSSACSEIVPALKRIKFYCDDFSKAFANTQRLLTNVEEVFLTSIFSRSIGDDSFEQIGKCCPRLKRLDLQMECGSVGLLSHYYPSLECLTYRAEAINLTTQTDELKTFLEKHSKLKRFECDYHFLWANRDLLTQTNIKLDSLVILLRESSIGTPSLDHFLNYLKTLHAHGFYKTLHLSLIIDPIYLSISTLLAMPTLETLRCYYLPSALDIARLSNLKELQLCFANNMSDEYVDAFAKNLINLERLTITNHPSRHILPFIRYSKKLETIHFIAIDIGLDLFTWNEERKNLPNSHRISLHLIEKDYLAAKWKAKVTSFSHIKIYRQFIELC